VGIDTAMVAAMSGDLLSVRAVVAQAAPDAASGGMDLALSNALDDLLTAVRESKAWRGRRRLRALVGADLCRHWTLAAFAGVASLRELRTIATTRCCQLFGGRPDDWAITADWSLARPFVCAAVPARAVRALQSAAARMRMGLQVESAVLVAMSSLEPWLPADGWVGWHTPTSLVLALRRGGKLVWLQTQRHVGSAANDGLIAEASRQVTRQCLRNGEAQPQTWAWLGEIDRGQPGAGGPALAPPLAPKVTVIDSAPAWLRHRPGTGEAQWAAVLAAAA
jgi:hypothetical protein